MHKVAKTQATAAQLMRKVTGGSEPGLLGESSSGSTATISPTRSSSVTSSVKHGPRVWRLLGPVESDVGHAHHPGCRPGVQPLGLLGARTLFGDPCRMRPRLAYSAASMSPLILSANLRNCCASSGGR
jgi:hypothetical protein